MSLFGLLNVAGDSLAAQSAGLNTTGQNISNVNTPGYVRRTAVLATTALDGNGQGSVTVSSIARSVDRFAAARTVTEQGRYGAASARADALGQLQSIVAPASNGIGDKVNGFFSAVHDLSGTPSDPAARTVVLSRATDLATAVSGAAGDIQRAQGDLLTTAQGVAGEVNNRLTQIAGLNKQIVETRATGGDAADLLDRRNTLVSDVADRIGGRSIEDASGSITLYAAGVALVDGNQAGSVTVNPGPGGAMQVTAHVGHSAVDVTAAVTDGSLGGIREARDVDMAHAATALDQFAADLSTAVNTAHAAGVGSDGVGGRNLFTAPPAGAVGAAMGMAVDPAVDGHPERIAAAGSVAELPGGNTAALRLAALASAPLGTAGGTPGERVGTMAADVGAAKASADAEQQLRQDTVGQARNLQDSASGVSLDEEMINMTRFQRAYQAGTQVLKTADTLLDGLMQSLP